MNGIEIYAWGDPREREWRLRTIAAAIVAASVVGAALGYAWAWMQGVCG